MVGQGTAGRGSAGQGEAFKAAGITPAALLYLESCGIHTIMWNFSIQITGTQPLLMHNAQLSDPLNFYTKHLAEITAKRKKTDDDHAEMARREWAGGLYFDPEMGPYLPGANIERMLLDAARMTRDGKTIERGLFIQEDKWRLEYKGSRDIETLMNDENFRFRASIKVGQQRVMRTRPKFSEWAVSAVGIFDEEQISPDRLPVFAERGGRLVGLGDWRPRYGRFTTVVKTWSTE